MGIEHGVTEEGEGIFRGTHKSHKYSNIGWLRGRAGSEHGELYSISAAVTHSEIRVEH